MLKVKRPHSRQPSHTGIVSLYDELHSYKLWVQRFLNAVYGGGCHPDVVIRPLDIVERVLARELRLCRHGDFKRQWGFRVSGSMEEL